MLTQVLRELLQQGSDEDPADKRWPRTHSTPKWGWCGHRKFSHFTLWLFLHNIEHLCNSTSSLVLIDYCSQIYEETLAKSAEEFGPLSNQVAKWCKEQNHGKCIGRLRLKVFNCCLVLNETIFQTMRKLRELDQAMEHLESRLNVSKI